MAVAAAVVVVAVVVAATELVQPTLSKPLPPKGMQLASASLPLQSMEKVMA